VRRLFFFFLASKERRSMLLTSPIVRIRIRIVAVVDRRVRIAKVNQSTPRQRARQLRRHLSPGVDAVEKLGERDGAVAGAGAGGCIFLVRAQIWRRGFATRRGRRRWVSRE
jgi:hypothetical protein